MATRGRGWDDRWESFPASKPIATENGIATRKQRGAMAETWWSARLVALLDSYGLGGRMQRGRRYARQGQLVSFEVTPGFVVAEVQGSRRQPYEVQIGFAPLTESQWGAVQAEIETTLRFSARLLAGEVPAELEEVFDDADVSLFPRRWSDLDAVCSCPDFGNPCKHVAAVLYVLADQLDDDPWLLLLWRGRGRDEILAHLGSRDSQTPEVAPWWPLRPGVALPVDSGRVDDWTEADPSASLRRLGPLDLTIRSRSAASLFVPAYEALRSD